MNKPDSNNLGNDMLLEAIQCQFFFNSILLVHASAIHARSARQAYKWTFVGIETTRYCLLSSPR
jgi:hypothetical protein